MRKIHQKKILEILGSLREAQKAGLFADCQEGAISIGEFIEGIEGDGTQTVALLESYCETLYKASIGEAGEKALERQLLRVENSVKNELKPTKIEVVFLSYKASMSDSLESIYLAAKEDPDCDAYWIPIPYFDRNTDGSAKVMHYEGAQWYDEKIVCTDWQKYNIEERRPDAIFTFNPYDDQNYVTSIHTTYYCSRLREQTDMLVYVPYLVHNEYMNSNFATVPGTFYSDKVILQSESIRQQYIAAIKSNLDDVDTHILEEKIVALGSPKADKVINLQKENIQICDEWREILHTPGSEKTIVLYNTTIDAALVNTMPDKGDLYLKKVKAVIEYFTGHPKAVLWWRPHPLLTTTMNSMRPHLYSEYIGIVNEFVEQKIGIYDTTADMYSAIAYADMCYGDSSSLNLLLQLIGKPVLIQNKKYFHEKSELEITAETIERVMNTFIDKQHKNNYILYEAEEATTEGFTLEGVIEYLPIIKKYGEQQSSKFRTLYENADGTAGQKVYDYIKAILRRQIGE